ncbi:hypothetical protein, partial [Kitasatospora sp. MBT63]|uniref:hypothetical protein n=1 Tax=Kitasatospora sp. MBT63 TaxID=1444768 RepID=UPI000539B2D3
LAGRPVASSSVFADTTLPAPAASSSAYDGLGRVSESTSGDVKSVPVHGHGGTATGTDMQPTSAQYPGAPFAADRQLDVSGNPLHKDL